MTIILELPPDLDELLRAEAAQRGLSKEEYALLKLRGREAESVGPQTAGEAICN